MGRGVGAAEGVDAAVAMRYLGGNAALVKQLLHAPIATLRERGDQDIYLTTARTLFRLDEPIDLEDA